MKELVLKNEKKIATKTLSTIPPMIYLSHFNG